MNNVIVYEHKLSDLFHSEYIETQMKLIGPKSRSCVVLDDGYRYEDITSVVFLNSIYWRTYHDFEQPITRKRVFPINNYTDETDTNCYSVIYNELILGYDKKLTPEQMMEILGRTEPPDPFVPIQGKEYWDPFFGDNYHLCVAMSVFEGKTYINKFIEQFARPYQVALDMLSLALLFNQAPLKKFEHITLDDRMDTRVAEKQMEAYNHELHAILGDPNSGLVDNILLPFMRTKLLKRNQLPQMFVCYGCRSDINNDMIPHAISASATSGHRTIQDFAVESLAAKKAAYSNSEVVSKAQYFARQCRLAGSQMPYIYESSCNSREYLEIIIRESFMKNYIGKIIRTNTNRDVLLTRENIYQYIDKKIKVYSPFACQYTNGICNRCAGYMYGNLSRYIPPKVKIGIYAMTKAVSKITQLILSTKHLIRTLSKILNLSPKALKYLMKYDDGLILHPSLREIMDRISIRISTNDIGTITDLRQKFIPVSDAYSRISYFDVFVDDRFIERVMLDDPAATPYLSEAMLTHMKQNWQNMKISSDDIVIPMKGWITGTPFMNYTIMNDDMISFVSRIESFLSTGIRSYHSIPTLVDHFTNNIYAKTDVELFYIEMMLRAFLITDEFHPAIPEIKDINQEVYFGGLSNVINTASLSAKLSFEDMGAMYRDPAMSLQELRPGINDVFFGF